MLKSNHIFIHLKFLIISKWIFKDHIIIEYIPKIGNRTVLASTFFDTNLSSYSF
jgi:hypothetical protein